MTQRLDYIDSALAAGMIEIVNVLNGRRDIVGYFADDLMAGG